MQQINELRQQLMECYNRGDFAALADLYTENATLHTATGEVAEGRQAIQKTFQGSFDLGATKIELNATEIKVFGDSAYDLGSYALRTVEGRAFGKGNYLVILQRRSVRLSESCRRLSMVRNKGFRFSSLSVGSMPAFCKYASIYSTALWCAGTTSSLPPFSLNRKNVCRPT